MSDHFKINVTFERTDARGTVLHTESHAARIVVDLPESIEKIANYAASTVTRNLPAFIGATK